MKGLIMAFLLVSSLSCKDTADKKAAADETGAENNPVEETDNARYGGLALYTVRDAMGEDAKATLQAVADAGYQNIEAAGYENGKFYGMSPEDFKSYLDGLALNPISTTKVRSL